MGRTKEFQEDINLAFQKLEELHPHMSLTELNHLVGNSIHYRNVALVHQGNIEKRKSFPIAYGVINGEISKKTINTIEGGRSKSLEHEK